MVKYKIEFNRDGCIGGAVCTAVAPKHWKMGRDGKAELLGGRNSTPGKWEKIIDEKDLKANKQAADGCPAVVIRVLDEKNRVVSGR